ncbi:MAG: hypothetical protein IT380_19810, partial [Myxococcales bacterium]|nr:hypothetical protein [Myxococcales bacterium]
MKRVLMGAVALLAAGCFQPTKCTSNAECTGGVCDTAMGVCVTSDGGTGGGGGGGGGVGGGGVGGGGGTGGGMGGGVGGGQGGGMGGGVGGGMGGGGGTPAC